MKFLTLFFLCVLCGCGYHCKGSYSDTSVSVPYVKGDSEGALTSQIIRQLSSSGQFQYSPSEGILILQVAIVSDKNEKIDYRYGRDNTTGDLTDHLYPTENRRTLSAEVVLLYAGSEEILFGPEIITAITEYDYVDVGSARDLSFVDPQGRRQIVLDFSQGQLDSIEGAQDDSLTPLYRKLAENIVAALTVIP